MTNTNTHSPVVGYVLWIFGFMGAHRFYYGKPVTGTLYFFTLIGLVVKLIGDLMYVVVDPRVQFGAVGK